MDDYSTAHTSTPQTDCMGNAIHNDWKANANPPRIYYRICIDWIGGDWKEPFAVWFMMAHYLWTRLRGVVLRRRHHSSKASQCTFLTIHDDFKKTTQCVSNHSFGHLVNEWTNHLSRRCSHDVNKYLLYWKSSSTRLRVVYRSAVYLHIFHGILWKSNNRNISSCPGKGECANTDGTIDSIRFDGWIHDGTSRSQSFSAIVHSYK